MDSPSLLSRLRASRTPLKVPGCMLQHLARPDARAREAKYLADCLAPYQGFDFGMFQIVEHDRRTTPSIDELGDFSDGPAPDLMWDFVFPPVLDAFFAAGLDEIDVQLYMQHRLGINSQAMHLPRADLAPDIGPKPVVMFAVPGFEMAAFSLELRGRRNIRPARRWLAEVFIPRWIEPVLQEPQRLPRHFVELGFLDIRPL